MSPQYIQQIPLPNIHKCFEKACTSETKRVYKFAWMPVSIDSGFAKIFKAVDLKLPITTILAGYYI